MVNGIDKSVLYGIVNGMTNITNDTLTGQIRAASNVLATQSELSSDVIFAKVVSKLRHLREQDITTDLIAATAISCAVE